MKKDIKNKLLETRRKRANEVPDFVFDFISSLTKSAISTQIEYIKDIEIYLTYLMELPQFENSIETILDFKPEDLGIVTERDIINYLDFLLCYTKISIKKDGTSKNNVYENTEQGQARKLASLHKLYKYLYRNKLIATDPSAHIEVKLEKSTGVTNVLDNSELKSFYNAIESDKNIESEKAMQFHKIIKQRDYVISLLLGYMGIRVSELVQIDISDVNLDKGTIKVIRKGKKTQVLDLPIKVIEPLAGYIKEREKVEGIEVKYKEALFLSLRKKRIDQRTVRYLTNKYKRRAEISTKISPHTFRRTFGSKVLNETGNLALAADLLGHETSETTRKHYILLDKKKERDFMLDFDYDHESVESTITVDIGKLYKLSKKIGMSIEELIKEIT